MATAETDSHLELKKRARRRLVGAVALALLAAVVLPMVMDQEPKPLNQDIQVRIPGRDSPFDGRVQPPATPATPATPVTPVTPVTPAVEPRSEAAVAEPAPAEKKAAEHTPQSKAPQPAGETESAKPVVAERHSERTAAKVGDKPVEKLARSEPASRDDKVDDARARAILNGDAQTNGSAAGRSGQFIVQLGVFGDPGNARKVQARVKSEGYNSFAEQLRTATGAKTRVRAGPFASRELAEQARAKLKRRGLDGVVAPQS